MRLREPTPMASFGGLEGESITPDEGRWPANVILNETRLKVLSLKNNIPSEKKEVIRRYYDGYNRVQKLREGNRNIPFENWKKKVLQSRVQSGVAEQECEGGESSDVRKESQREVEREDESSEKEECTERGGTPSVEGKIQTQRVRNSKGGNSNGRGEKPGETDGVLGREKRDSRAQIEDGKGIGPSTQGHGDSSSQERGKGRQPNRKSGSSKGGKTRQKPRRDKRGVEETEKGKRRFEKGKQGTQEETLYVLESDVPHSWRKYFEEVDEIVLSSTAEMLDGQSGVSKSTGGITREGHFKRTHGEFEGSSTAHEGGLGDEGGASRFFYCAKAHKSERNVGLEDLEDVKMGQSGGARQKLKEGEDEYQTGDDVSVGLNKIKEVKNDIATLKPINLMRYLVRLVTPPDGTVLDPFAGSGTTGCACEIEGFDYILIEKRERFANIIAPKRCEYWSKEENWDDLKEHRELEDPQEKKVRNLEEFV